jgi:hypothetical protein
MATSNSGSSTFALTPSNECQDGDGSEEDGSERGDGEDKGSNRSPLTLVG